MSGTFTDGIYLCYSTNVKRKCKGFQWHTVRNTGEIPIQHLAKMQMGVYIMELTEKKEFDLLSLGEIMLRLSPPDNERITRGDSFSKQAGGAELNAITGAAMLGLRCGIISKLPANDLGVYIKNRVRLCGVSDDYLVYDDDKDARLGVYYYENGAYPRNDGSVRQIPLKDGKPVHNLYNTDAAWGAQWNLTQVWALAYPEYYSDYISSHLLVYKDAGWLADGIANSRYVSGVGTNLLSTIIAGAYQCSIRDFDVNTAYEACLKNELDGENRPLGAGKIDTRYFVEYGYVPHLDKGDGPDEAFMFSASHTLEYAYSAWAVAQWAKQLGKTDDYNRLMDLSKGWERIYDPSCNFVRPKKKDGTFIEDFNPMQVWRGFQEGNAWQYTFYVPHDAKGLVAKVGADVFNHRLDSIFTVSRKLIFSGGTEVGAFAGLQTLYNQGNQPCLHIPWMFNEAGRPSLTQKWVRAILNEFYGTDGIHGYGYGQDEDQGQLGAWYVISSLGLFDMKGLTDQAPSFALGSPLFDKITIRLNDRYYKGKEFVIETRNNSKQNDYVQSMNLNGKPLTDTRIPFSEIVQGGHLVLEMGSQPKDRYEN